MRPPCQDCPDRWANENGNCHAICERYQDYNRHNIARREAWKNGEAIIRDYTIRVANKRARENARKKGNKK